MKLYKITKIIIKVETVNKVCEKIKIGCAKNRISLDILK